MPPFDPLSFLTVLVAISLGCLGRFIAYLLGLPEWRWPREYIRSEHESSEFCMYIFLWALDSYDTAFLFFGLLGTLIERAFGFWWRYCQRSRHEREVLAGEKPVTISEATAVRDVKDRVDTKASLSPEELDDVIGGFLENILDGAAGKVEGMGSVAVEKFDRFQTRLNDSETRHREDQERIKQLLGANNALESQKSDLETRLDAQQQTISSIQSANTALKTQNTSLKTSLSAEQEARKGDAQKASDAAKEADACIKRQVKEIVAQRQEKDDAITAAEQEQREHTECTKQLQEKHESEQAALQDKLETAESEQEDLQDKLETAESEQEDLQDRLETAESKGQGLQAKLDTARTELSEFREKFDKTTNHASALQKKLTAANETIEDRDVKYKALSDGNSATEKRNTQLEQEIKALKSAKKQQQQGANPQRINELNKATERAKNLERQHNSDRNRSQEQLKNLNSEVQKLNGEIRAVRLENEKSMEKHNQATAKQTEKLRQEHQLKQELQQEELDKAQLLTQELQDALKILTAAKEKQSIEHKVVLEAKDEEHRKVVRSSNARIEELEACGSEATEKTAEHDRIVTHAQAELKTVRDDLKVKSSTIESLRFELELASVEIEEVKGVICLLEKKKWHEYAKQQEAWILESYTAIEDNLGRAESYIQHLEVAFEGLKEELEVALEARDEALAIQKRQYGEAAHNASDDLKASPDHGNVLGSRNQELEEECKNGEAIESQDGELAMKTGPEETQAVAAEKSGSDQSDDDKQDEDEDAGVGAHIADHDDGTSQSSLPKDGEDDFRNDSSGNLDESTLTGEKKRKANRRSCRAGEKVKCMAAFTGDQPIDMASAEVQRLMVTSQADSVVNM